MARNVEVSLQEERNESALKIVEKKIDTRNGKTEILSINEHTWQIFLDKKVIEQLKMYDNSENCKNWSPAKCPSWCM